MNDSKPKNELKESNLLEIYENLIEVNINILSLHYLDSYIIRYIIYNHFEFINYQSLRITYFIKRYKSTLLIIKINTIYL